MFGVLVCKMSKCFQDRTQFYNYPTVDIEPLKCCTLESLFDSIILIPVANNSTQKSGFNKFYFFNLLHSLYSRIKLCCKISCYSRDLNRLKILFNRICFISNIKIFFNYHVLRWILRSIKTEICIFFGTSRKRLFGHFEREFPRKELLPGEIRTIFQIQIYRE